MWLFFIFIMLISTCAWSEELKNPFVSPIDKIEYQRFLDKKKEEDRTLAIKKKEEESKKIREELLKRQNERKSIDEKRKKEQMEIVDKKIGAPNLEEQDPSSAIMKSIELQGIIFNENKKDSRVIIEGEIYAEGEIIADKIEVVNIQKDYVEFSYQGFKFKKEILLKLKDEDLSPSRGEGLHEPIERNREYKKNNMKNAAGSTGSKIMFKKME